MMRQIGQAGGDTEWRKGRRPGRTLIKDGSPQRMTVVERGWAGRRNGAYGMLALIVPVADPAGCETSALGELLKRSLSANAP